MYRSNKIIVFTNIFSVMLLLGFIALALCVAFSDGVCCADDAYYAMTAKNLANGSGYATSLPQAQTRYFMQAFDPWSGVGPTIILPAALFIKAFGNTYWAPGLANVFLWSILLVLIGYYLRKYNSRFRFALFTLSFLYLSYSLMTCHFEQWYALLGEVPAALLTMLGILCFLDRDKKNNQILTGVLFYLAIQAKVLALIVPLVFVVMLLFLYPRSSSESFSLFFKKLIGRILYMSIGFLVPLIAFETWKIITLGPSGFIENWRTFISHIGLNGTQLSQSSSWLDLYHERSEILMDRFGIFPVYMLIILILAWLMIKRDETLISLFIILCSINTIYSIWWLFLSNGWARYFIICLILFIFTISLPLLSSRSKRYILSYVVLIVIFSSANWTKLNYPFEKINRGYFVPSIRTKSLLETAGILSQYVGSGDERIATETWQTAADIEYIMPTSLNFTTFRDVASLKNDSFWLAANTRFVDKNDLDFQDFLERCGKIQEIGVYLIAQCGTNVP